jgi:hypothetical protein
MRSLDSAFSIQSPRHSSLTNGPLGEATVVRIDYKGWSLYGVPWLQPVANGGKSPRRENRKIKRKLLPWVATGCRLERMVRNAMKEGLLQ